MRGDYKLPAIDGYAGEYEFRDYLYALTIIRKPKLIVDCGTGHGCSAYTMALATEFLEKTKQNEELYFSKKQIDEREKGYAGELWQYTPSIPTIYSVDIADVVLDTNIDKNIFNKYVKLVKSDSIAFLQNFKEKVGIAVLDTHPNFQHCLKEFELARNLLEPGGYIVAHDIFYHECVRKLYNILRNTIPGNYMIYNTLSCSWFTYQREVDAYGGESQHSDGYVSRRVI